MGAVKAQRVMVSDIINTHLERAGQTVRVHPDSLERRGIDRTPEPKLLPSESRQYREHGVVSPTMDQVLVTRAERARQLPLEQDNACMYWVGRKHTLGVTPNLSHEQRLERITQARERLVQEPREHRRVPVQTLDGEAKDLQQSIAGLERYAVDLHTQHIFEQAAERAGRQRSVPEQWRVEKVLAAGKVHGLPQDHEAEKIVAIAETFERTQQRTRTPSRSPSLLHELGRDEPQAGSSLRVKLYDKEQERDQGMGF